MESLGFDPSTLTFAIERNFSSVEPVAWVAKNMPMSFATVIAYLMAIKIGTAFMSSRKPFDLKYILAAWNAFLCIFSFIGMCKTVPHLINSILSNTFEYTVCAPGGETWGSGPTGFWVFLFMLSKMPELLDTLFIVLRKKPLIFLHWYHHVTVLLFCWNAYATEAGSGLYFVAMNYSVHAIMYGYYCLQTVNMVPKWFPTILITLGQIAQMFVGTGVCASCWYFWYTGRVCHNEINNLIAGALMYGSYLYLFCDFAVRRYVFPSKKPKSQKQME